MTEQKLDQIVGKFSDGNLNREEYKDIMREIRTKQDYLVKKEYDRLVILSDQEGMEKLTKCQFVQCREYALFQETGVTRD